MSIRYEAPADGDQAACAKASARRVPLITSDQPPDLTEDDKVITVELLVDTIERDRFPWSPW
jgi:hypothetical protein